MERRTYVSKRPVLFVKGKKGKPDKYITTGGLRHPLVPRPKAKPREET